MSFYSPYEGKLPGFDDTDRRLIIEMAFNNSSGLHHSTGTPRCSRDNICDTCIHAARLAFQYLEPKLRERFIAKIHHVFGYRCPVPHPSSD